LDRGKIPERGSVYNLRKENKAVERAKERAVSAFLSVRGRTSNAAETFLYLQSRGGGKGVR